MSKAQPLKGVGLLLAPGASADSSHNALVAIDEAASALGATVARMDFPYVLAGRKAPDREPVLLAAVEEAAKGVRVKPGRLALGGRSMGGRMCSMAVAEGRVAALALVLVSYPLHPPGRPDKLRTAHLPAVTVPCLFVSGTRDAFGTPAELEAATTAIPAPVTHVWLEGKDHSLRGCDARVADEVAAWLTGVARG